MLTKVDNAMEAKPIPVRKMKHVYVYDTVNWNSFLFSV